MTYYDDYIRERAERAYDFEKAEFTIYDGRGEEVHGSLTGELNRQLFIGAMREMVRYIYHLRNKATGGGNIELLWDADNVENIYVTARGLEAPTVIVEYETLPDWFELENADLREFYWHPDPGLSGEWSAAYFQPR